MCGVFHELLCDGGTARYGIARKVVEYRFTGRQPVHAVVREEAMVLDGNKRFNQSFGELTVWYIDAVFGTGDPFLLPFDRCTVAVDAILGGLILHHIESRRRCTGFCNIEQCRVDGQIEIVIDVDGENGADNDAGDQADQQYGEQNIQYIRQSTQTALAEHSEYPQHLQPPVDLGFAFVFFWKFCHESGVTSPFQYEL